MVEVNFFHNNNKAIFVILLYDIVYLQIHKRRLFYFFIYVFEKIISLIYSWDGVGIMSPRKEVINTD